MTLLTVAIAIARAADEILGEAKREPPAELFHYTDTIGLIGILKNKELRASDIRCMNDTDEVTLGRTIVQSAIRKQEGHPAHGLLCKLLEHPAFVSVLLFALSFTEIGDLLSQWRAYADNGAGFAVGFAPGKLSALEANGKLVTLYFAPVEYDSNVQQTRADRLIARFLDALQPALSQEPNHQHDQVNATALALVLGRFVATCKNSGFAEEAEHRIVVDTCQDPLLQEGATPELTVPVCEFRAGRYGLTPFITLSLPGGLLTGAISRIVIGPRTLPDTEQKLRVLMGNSVGAGWSKFRIDRAVATYR